MKTLIGLIGLMLLVLFSSSIAQGSEALGWPQFRGPAGSGIADTEKPPVEFGPEKNVLWCVATPSGLSSPIVVDDMLVITAFENDKLYTIAYNRADGHEAWRAEAPAKEIEPYNQTEGSPAASTAATDGKRIVTYFGSCGLFCYDSSGNQLWTFPMDPAVTIYGFGTGVSPVLTDDTVVLLRDETKAPKIMAIDATTGRLKWKKARQSRSSFGTPAVWNTPEGKQIAAPGFGKLIGYALESGDEQWYVEGMPASSCTTPVVADGTLYYAGWSPGDPSDKTFKMPDFDAILKQAGAKSVGHITQDAAAKSPFLKVFFDNNDTNKDGILTRDEWDAMLKMIATSRNSAFALKPGGSGDVSATHVLWKQTKGLPYVASAILYRGQYVMVKDGGIVTAYDAATGGRLYQKRAVASGNYYASPVAANGLIYFTALADGAITVLEAGSDNPRVVAENPPLGERVAATPAIADDTLYVRTAGHLYAFAER